MASAALSVGIWSLATLACAWLTGEAGGVRRAAALLAGLVALLAALLWPPAWVLSRFVLTLAGALVWFRTLDLTLRWRPLPFATRLWLLVGLFDVRRAERGPPRFDRREARWWLIHALASAIAVVAILALAPQLPGNLRWLLRWAAGACLCYASVELLHSSLLLGYRRAGIDLARINDFPIRATTLAEFWGRRWNRVVAGWLRDYLYFPLARRRRPILAIVAAFAGSTALHFWLAWVPLDLAGGLMMASFFVVQAAALLLERRLGVRNWSRARQRAWTIAWLLLSSPLFVEPSLRIYFGPPPAGIAVAPTA